MRRLLLAATAASLLTLAACAPTPTPSPPTPPLAAPTDVVVGNATAVLACEDGDCLATTVPRSTSTPLPLRFVLPTPGAEPVFGWRPPLYPVPWAISPHDHFYFIRPIPADQVNWPLADYRYGGIFFRSDVVHSGVDIPADHGSPVLAAGAGTVIWADWGLFSGSPGYVKDPYGKAVAIRHDFGYQGRPLYTIYAHLSRIDVAPGQHLQTGDQLGLVGDTGYTTGPHLHFEVRWGENSFYSTYNPELWMVPPEGRGVLVGRVMDDHRRPLRHLTVEVIAAENRRWRAVKTYGSKVVNSDPYYNENMVLSDLPAGWYDVTILYNGREYTYPLEIFPGQVTYFTFQGRLGFDTALPPTPRIEDLTASPRAP